MKHFILLLLVFLLRADAQEALSDAQGRISNRKTLTDSATTGAAYHGAWDVTPPMSKSNTIAAQRILQEADGTTTTNGTTEANGDGHGDGHDDEHEHDEHGHDDEHANEKPWGPALFGALLVNLCTLIGLIVVLIPTSVYTSYSQTTKDFCYHLAIPSFACGALLATSVFLLLPEAVHLIGGGHEDHDDHDDGHRKLEGEEEPSESEVAWKFGVAIMSGYFLPFILSLWAPHGHESIDAPSVDDHVVDENATAADAEKCECCEDEVHNADSPHVAAKDTDVRDSEVVFATDDEAIVDDPLKASSSIKDDKQKAPTIDYSLAMSVLIGDFFHNFADGIFIGASFLLCDRSVAITVTAATVFHELPQELADYFLLTNQCGLIWWKALIFNFVSGLSVMLGVAIFLAVNDITNTVIGVILAMSAGVYLYVSLTECGPRINEFSGNSVSRRVWSVFFWILGAIPIGLVLLNHEHCD